MKFEEKKIIISIYDIRYELHSVVHSGVCVLMIDPHDDDDVSSDDRNNNRFFSEKIRDFLLLLLLHNNVLLI